MAEEKNKTTSTKKTTNKKVVSRKDKDIKVEDKEVNKENNNIFIIIIVILVAIIFGLVWFIAGQKTPNILENNNNKEWNSKNISWEINITVIWDKRCSDCNTDLILNQIKQAPFLMSANFEVKDFSDEDVEKLLKENSIKNLPAFIFSTNNLNDWWSMSPYLTETPGWLFKLEVWSKFDPYAEICNNWVDDNNNGSIDCEDETCNKELSCAAKVDKPKAELFIMSYCPFGTQAQKGFLEAMLKLKNVADMKIKFVHYLMHEKKEWDENLVQYCIQKEQDSKFTDYLQCFLKAWERESCRTEVWIDETKLQACITTTEETINYSESLADTSNKFPSFNLDKEDAMKYWVQGSPSFVLNGILVENAWRNAKAYADLICDSFKEKPEVCNEEFNDTTYDPNFWFTSNGQAVEWGCGG